MGQNWSVWVCLFLSGLVIAAGWSAWRRNHRIVAERLTWFATSVGVGVILLWLSVLLPEQAVTLWLAFIIGGLPAVLLGLWSVVAFMLEAAHRE